jgi:hypothetical protein
MNATARKLSHEQLLDHLRREVLAELGELPEDELQRQVEIKRKLHFHRLSLLAVKARRAAREIGGAA